MEATITKKQLDDIEKILGRPLCDLLTETPHKRVLDISGLPKTVQHQIQDVLETTMTMDNEVAVRIVRQGLKERSNRQARGK